MSSTPAPPPEPRAPGRYALAFVCLGNICRSPMADVVMRATLLQAGLADRVSVASFGTGDWHVGKPMDHRAAATLSAAGLDPTRHRAQQFVDTWHESHDLLLAMDEQNLADVGGRTDRTRLFRDFDPVEPGSEVPDPYYGGDGGFQEVLTMVERTCGEIAAVLKELLEP